MADERLSAGIEEAATLSKPTSRCDCEPPLGSLCARCAFEARQQKCIHDIPLSSPCSTCEIDYGDERAVSVRTRDVAQGAFDTQYRDGLEEIRRYAKKLRNSRDLVGPAEYAGDARALKIWQRALYHEGKTIEGMVKAALVHSRPGRESPQ